VDLSDWCNWRGALRHRSGDVVPPEDLIEALVAQLDTFVDFVGPS
jgi:hypothetical protein